MGLTDSEKITQINTEWGTLHREPHELQEREGDPVRDKLEVSLPHIEDILNHLMDFPFSEEDHKRGGWIVMLSPRSG